jgi:putative hemolysin
VSRIWLRHWAETRLGGAQASPGIERPQRLLIAAAMGIASLVFALGALLAFDDQGLGLLRTLAVAALTLLVGGQLVPRAIARRWSTALVATLTPLLGLLEWAFRPVVRLARQLTRPFTRRAGAHEETPRDALEDLLREGEMEGVGAPAESAIISGVVEFGEKRVADVMTPRGEIVAVERRSPAADIIRTASQSNYSRIPVYDDDLDHVVGLVHSFDLLARPASPVSILRKVVVARPGERCDELMRRLLRERVHLAIIQDEAGSTRGLVTLEDLVEELVGEIGDEHDEPPAS